MALSAAKPKRRTQAERREEAERRLIEAAIRLLAEKGYDGFSLAEVGEAAGYSRGLPAHYFGRREVLLARVAEHIVDAYRLTVARPPPAERGLPHITTLIRQYARRANPTASQALIILITEAIVIAAINGAAMGGGCEIALGCDFRLIADTAKIGLTEIRFGALPAGGGTARAPRLIGLQEAKRLVMIGEPVDAAEAKRIGLVDEVLPPDELLPRALALAAVLASRAPYAMRTAKQLLNKSLEVDLATALELERALIGRMATPEELQQARDEAAARSPTYAGIFSKPDGSASA